MKNRRSEITKRELEILNLLAKGLSSEEIAQMQAKKKGKASKRTVDAHRNNMMLKLNAHNVAHLVAIAYQEKLIDL